MKTQIPRLATLAKAFLGIAAIASMTCLSSTAFAGKPTSAKTKMDTPLITCGTANETSINIQVCAASGTSATGMSAGFSVQWMTLENYEALNEAWPTNSDDPALVGVLCKASFSGNAIQGTGSYNLPAGTCVTVNVGDFLFDEGASATCTDPLLCGHDYVFRAFAHATSTLTRSDFTPTLFCSTKACAGPIISNCTYTQGFWKTHSIDPTGNNKDEWPDSVKTAGMDLGTVHYDEAALEAILNTPAGGNGLIALAHQLIAAKLNIANGADSTDIAAAIALADSKIGGLVVPPSGNGSLLPKDTNGLVTELANYNEGGTGPGHCGSASTTP